ncbi:MAG: hypothetical protein R3B68_01810 [Phycisphaerales bacterium]
MLEVRWFHPVILTESGVALEEHGPSNRVLTHAGRFRPCTPVLVRRRARYVAIFSDEPIAPLVVRSEQSVLAGDGESQNRASVVRWKSAGSLRAGDYLLEPIVAAPDSPAQPTASARELGRDYVRWDLVGAPTLQTPLQFGVEHRRDFLRGVLDEVEFVDPVAFFDPPDLGEVLFYLPSDQHVVELRTLLNAMGVFALVNRLGGRSALSVPPTILSAAAPHNRLRAHMASRGVTRPAGEWSLPTFRHSPRPVTRVDDLGEHEFDRWHYSVDEDRSFTLEGVVVGDRTRST